MKDLFRVFLFLFLLSNTISNAQQFTFEDIPDWVVEKDTIIKSEVSKYDIISGYYKSQIDYQINLENDSYFQHEIINVSSFSGITNASQLAVVYDTSFQKLIVHHLYIRRDGKKIDRTEEISLEILNNEQSLHMGIYTGQITAYDILEDIRKDDLIDFAFTLVGNNPIFDDEKYAIYPLESMNPTDYFSLRVIYPNDINIIYECVDCDTNKIIHTEFQDYQELKLEYFHIPAVELEDFMPSWFIPFKYFMLSSMSSWKEVNKWAQGVFTLEKAQNLSEVFEEVLTGNENMDEKIDKIINYVQDDIRYMGIESGIGSIKPFSPEQVVKQRFGDCKDKSLLLVTLLNQIGIDKAYPALVNSVSLIGINDFLPGPEIFNHCIVNFEHNDTSYWIDPSMAQQGGGYKKIFTPDYGKSLIVGVEADALQDVDMISQISEYYVTEEIFINSFSEPSTLKIESVRFGLEADKRRSLLDHFSLKDLTDRSIQNTGRLFPRVEQVKEVKIEDNIEDNIFTMNYEYLVDDYWIDGDEQNDSRLKGLRYFRFEPTMIYDFLKESACIQRKYPMEQFFPVSMKYIVIIHFPENILIEDHAEIFENDVFYYKEKIEQIDKNTIQLDYILKTLTNEISIEQYSDICGQKKEITDNLQSVFYFLK